MAKMRRNIWKNWKLAASCRYDRTSNQRRKGGRRLYVLLVLVLALTGCQTINDHQSYVERHRIESMMARMDSVMSKQTTVVQDSSWHETFIRELQSIREHNDTSHTVVVDTAGNVIKEKLEIWHERETLSERDRQEMEGMRHSMERMDSTMSMMREQLNKSDSLLQAMEHEKTITKAVPWYRQLWDNLRFILIGVAVGVVLMLTRKIWLAWLPINKS